MSAAADTAAAASDTCHKGQLKVRRQGIEILVDGP
jgi:hypothetical protein